MLSSLAERLSATRLALTRGLASLFGGGALSAETRDDLEAALLQADLGVSATRLILDLLDKASASDARTALHDILLQMLLPFEQPLTLPVTQKPFVIMVVGVNGAGKTTTIGKLAHQLQQRDLRVMLAAGDTFRAAAVEQLKVWGERNAVPVIAQPTGADAAAVAHDALQAAKARGNDVLIVDTAGRLHTQSGLMDELKKIKRVLQKTDPSAPHEVLLVLDAGIGQNAIAQLKHFHEAVGVTGLVLTKLDGTAKGGVVFALAEQFKMPIRFIGVGEGIDDLQPFVARDFVDALLPIGNGITRT